MAEERLGYSLAELKNRHIREIYKEPGFSDQKLDYIRSTGEANSYEAVILTKDGQERILEVNKAPLHDAAGRLIGFAAVSRDITRRRRAEERVNELQELMTSGHPAVVESELIGTRVRDLMNAKPVSILPDMTVAQAAERMLQHDLAGLPVVGAAGDVLGLVTMKELVRRGLFHGVDWTTPVHRVMQSDYAAVQPDTFYFDALTAMVKGGAPVVLATEGRHLRGVLTMNDLMRSRGASVIGVLEGIDAQTTIEGLAGFRPEVDRILASLVVDGALASQITGIITEFNDRITRRVVALCEARLGPSPAHYAWLGLGSEGRKEQTLTTDQDNALVFEDWVQGDENALVYFSRLAQEVVRALERCGFKVCLGQIMASQPKWSGGLELWLERVRTWVGVPTARGTRDAMTFLDFRTVYGDAGLARSLRDQANQIFRENPRVLTPMAEDTLSKAPPLGLFKRFILEKSGDYKGMLNLKAQGTLVLVDALRLLAVKEGLFETNTLDRLAGLSQRNLFTTSQADSIREAYQTLMGLRLRANIRAIQEHRDPNNHVDPDQLPHWHQQRLRDAFLIAEDLQKAVRQNFWWLGR
jgi:CBS domain-containing protein